MLLAALLSPVSPFCGPSELIGLSFFVAGALLRFRALGLVGHLLERLPHVL